MKVYWDKTGPRERAAVVALCGWATKKGTVTRTGRRIAATSWEQLTPAARNVLTRHGIAQ